MVNDKKILHKHTERRDAAENRQRILDAAFKLFEQNGVEEVSMNQIATEAKIGPGTLYRRYKNKGELCLDLIRDNVVLLFEDIDAYLEEHREESPRLRFKGVLSLFIQFRENKAQLLKGVEDAAPSKSRNPLSKGPIYSELHQIFVNLFEEIYETGFPKVNNVFRSDTLLQALRSDFYLFQREVRGYSPEVILEQLYSTFISD
ncbi:TetR/AcrR family transcriptional regulator [Bacillus siamensis]|uniref:TetR/AcrR family transcriptional regulator n=1 Tax=Bacillus siamensis TaxID=659243 RepID=UPI00068B3F43|nr:TetR/AcrR family transcriptional regulator [Bacillus siamensis]MDU0811832.1 TetR/AcrR family transcriptional regulator [Bacillus siamensis]MED5049851.1 TetR/AcrR family transcriptional regulator [Bacillus siamensis]MED5097678.1 TetR/AcrR family transcriptional regulator [Bacillus siamensis]